MSENTDMVYMEKGEDGVAVVYLNQPKKKNAINTTHDGFADGLLPCCRRGPRSSRDRSSRFGQLLYERRRFEPKLPRGKHPRTRA